MWQCSNCGKNVEDNLEVCWNCGTGKDGSPPLEPKNLGETSNEGFLVTNFLHKLNKSGFFSLPRDFNPTRGEPNTKIGYYQNRYLDAYRVARTTIFAGGVIKIMGVVLGGIIFLVALALAGSLGLVLGGLGLAIAVGVAIGILAVGTLVSAQGQLLLATLDGTVNTSPFLTDEEKRDIMRIPA